MGTVGIRDLARRASSIIEDLTESREPTLITRHGRPVAYMLPVDEREFEDFVLANAPEFVEGLAEADAELRAGATTSLAAFRREHGAEARRAAGPSR
ncbi:MAG: type II toxin-antitoxin system Phd/YefM family antitoxin [Thermoleophilaceae bacterium]